MKQIKKPTLQDLLRYAEHPVPFAESGHVWINDKQKRSWTRFQPWPSQVKLLHDLFTHRKILGPKARQVAFTTTTMIYNLWQMLFRPVAEIAYFSLSGRESRASLERISGMYKRLPDNMQYPIVRHDRTKGVFQIGAPDGTEDGSIIHSLPNNAGESLTFNTLVIDEAGRMYKYSDLYGRVLPAIEDVINNGDGQMIIMGIYDKWNPDTLYRQQIMDGLDNVDGWKTLFLGWDSRPDRDQDWFDAKKKEMFRQFGTDDMRKQQYPSSIKEMLSEPESDKRIPTEFLEKVSSSEIGLTDHQLKDIPNLTVFQVPEPDVKYMACADVAEGLPSSDFNVTRVFRKDTMEGVSIMRGRFLPEIHAGYTHKLCTYYNNAPVLPERNNHGHSFISSFSEISAADGSRIKIVDGPDGRPGWFNSRQKKIYMYDKFMKIISEAANAGTTIIKHQQTEIELSTIKSSTLSCPSGEGFYDDCAIACAMSAVAIELNVDNITAMTI